MFPQGVSKKEIEHQDYGNVLQINKPLVAAITSRKGYIHQLYNVVQDKVALRSYYDTTKLINFTDCVPFVYSPKAYKTDNRWRTYHRGCMMMSDQGFFLLVKDI